MPTYSVFYSNLKLNQKIKKKIANGITKVHRDITGANSYFVQVIFINNKKNNHFMGGKEVYNNQIFLHGQIRSGRTTIVKKELILKLKDVLIKSSKLEKENIWIYILDLKPDQMIEYGEVLPKSGQEKKWFNKLDKSLQKKLQKIETV